MNEKDCRDKSAEALFFESDYKFLVSTKIDLGLKNNKPFLGYLKTPPRNISILELPFSTNIGGTKGLERTIINNNLTNLHESGYHLGELKSILGTFLDDRNIYEVRSDGSEIKIIKSIDTVKLLSSIDPDEKCLLCHGNTVVACDFILGIKNASLSRIDVSFKNLS